MPGKVRLAPPRWREPNRRATSLHRAAAATNILAGADSTHMADVLLRHSMHGGPVLQLAGAGLEYVLGLAALSRTANWISRAREADRSAGRLGITSDSPPSLVDFIQPATEASALGRFISPLCYSVASATQVANGTLAGGAIDAIHMGASPFAPNGPTVIAAAASLGVASAMKSAGRRLDQLGGSGSGS